MQEFISPQITAIRERYKASLPDKAVMIEEQIEILSSAGAARDLSATHEVLHKLAGSAGMYGYDDISALSRTAMACTVEKKIDLLLAQLAELKSLLEQHA